jgi:hypothetical protein
MQVEPYVFKQNEGYTTKHHNSNNRCRDYGAKLTTKEWTVSNSQSILVSGTNIKTINYTTLLGVDIVVGGCDMTFNQSIGFRNQNVYILKRLYSRELI